MWKLWTVQNEQLIPLENMNQQNDTITNDIEIANNVDFHSDSEHEDSESENENEDVQPEPVEVPTNVIKKKQKVVVRRKIM